MPNHKIKIDIVKQGETFHKMLEQLEAAGYPIEEAMRELNKAFGKNEKRFERLKVIAKDFSMHIKKHKCTIVTGQVNPKQPNFARFQNKGFKRRGK